MSANQKRQMHPHPHQQVTNASVSDAYAAQVLSQMNQLNAGSSFNMNQARNSNNLGMQQHQNHPKSQMNYMHSKDMVMNQAYHNSTDAKDMKLQFYPSAKMDKSSKKLQGAASNIRGNSSNQVLTSSGQIIESYGGQVPAKRADQTQTIKASSKVRG